jgi:hypothetical protein
VLQRSAMFLTMIGAVPRFRSSGAGRIFLILAFYKHYVPTGRRGVLDALPNLGTPRSGSGQRKNFLVLAFINIMSLQGRASVPDGFPDIVSPTGRRGGTPSVCSREKNMTFQINLARTIF